MHTADVVHSSPHGGGFLDCWEFSRQQSRCHLNWNIKPLNPHGFRANVSRREYGSIVFANVQHDPISGTRHIADINRRDDQVIGLTLFGKGAMTFSQGGLELLIQSHELLLWDGTRPGSLQSWEPVECKTILFPRNLVCQHIGDVDDLTGRKIGIDTGTGLLLNSHIETLHQSVGLIAPRDMSTVLRATLGMVGACFRPLDATPTGTAYHKNLFRRVEELMRETLLEPTFSATMVAASFGFSPRALHRLFAEAGTTFSVWVRKERLARAERALASPGLTAESITQIAHRFGFCDAAHFSNSFKVQYGASPKAYRLAARELK